MNSTTVYLHDVNVACLMTETAPFPPPPPPIFLSEALHSSKQNVAITTSCALLDSGPYQPVFTAFNLYLEPVFLPSTCIASQSSLHQLVFTASLPSINFIYSQSSFFQLYLQPVSLPSTLFTASLPSINFIYSQYNQSSLHQLYLQLVFLQLVLPVSLPSINLYLQPVFLTPTCIYSQSSLLQLVFTVFLTPTCIYSQSSLLQLVFTVFLTPTCIYSLPSFNLYLQPVFLTPTCIYCQSSLLQLVFTVFLTLQLVFTVFPPSTCIYSQSSLLQLVFTASLPFFNMYLQPVFLSSTCIYSQSFFLQLVSTYICGHLHNSITHRLYESVWRNCFNIPPSVSCKTSLIRRIVKTALSKIVLILINCNVFLFCF